MYAGKPIIGLVGGIGSGKSFVAKLFGDEGCVVVDSDAQVREAYRDPAVLGTLKEWWGDEIVHPDGTVNRPAIASRVFQNAEAKHRLETLIHPLVHAARERQMQEVSQKAQVVAYVWDTPLLIEAGLAPQCDAVVFVDASLTDRFVRTRARSGWGDEELLLREKSQTPLDMKRSLSDYVISNAADAQAGPEALTGLREQVRRVLSQVLAGSTTRSPAPDRRNPR